MSTVHLEREERPPDKLRFENMKTVNEKFWAMAKEMKEKSEAGENIGELFEQANNLYLEQDNKDPEWFEFLLSMFGKEEVQTISL